ncbi:MAG: hypothetical protein M1498_03835 [Candidatus Thermoplasmatota archaeon]|nr:hypothetical protein [Candidatus Thermoplasmatota archaeon]MCL5889048.1 hypothetical protein [Candidatus Thermoplasmatota archaeon]
MVLNSTSFWQGKIEEARLGEKVTVPKNIGLATSPKPKDSGLFRRSVGEIKGQIADWRATVPETGQCVHAVEYRDRYELHIDKYDPATNPVEHLLHDSPKYGTILLAGTFAVFAIARILLKRK